MTDHENEQQNGTGNENERNDDATSKVDESAPQKVDATESQHTGEESATPPQGADAESSPTQATEGEKSSEEATREDSATDSDSGAVDAASSTEKTASGTEGAAPEETASSSATDTPESSVASEPAATSEPTPSESATPSEPTASGDPGATQESDTSSDNKVSPDAGASATDAGQTSAQESAGSETAAASTGEKTPSEKTPEQTEEEKAKAAAELEKMREVWEELKEKKNSRETVDVKVTGKNRGGIVAEYKGVEIFIPQSHWTVDRSESSNKAEVGETYPVNILDITQFDTDARRVTGSRRAILRKQLLESLEPGQKLKGRVSTLTHFGAFVDIGGVDGLLHVSEISHARNKKPAELLREGQEIDVVIKGVENKGKRISLGRKELIPSPWQGVAERYPADSIQKGTVVSLTDIGAFVQIEPGVDGLLRPREISWTKRTGSASDVLNTGEEVEVMILSVNEEQERMSLSMRRVGENPWPDIVERFSEEGKEWEAEVIALSNKGAVVSVDDVEGFLPRGRMGRQANKLTELKPGDKLTVHVVEVDPKRPSVIFGLPREGGGSGSGSGGRQGGGRQGGGGRRRDGRRKSGPPPQRAKPRNEMKSPTTQSSFSLGDMVSEELKQKFGIEEPQPEPEAKPEAKPKTSESTSGEQAVDRDAGTSETAPDASTESSDSPKTDEPVQSAESPTSAQDKSTDEPDAAETTEAPSSSESESKAEDSGPEESTSEEQTTDASDVKSGEDESSADDAADSSSNDDAEQAKPE